MMTIEGVLHLRGSEMNLYSPRYFKDSSSPVEQLKDMIRGGGILLLGQEVRNYSPTVVTVNGDLVKHHLSELEITYENRTFTMKGSEEYWIVPESWLFSHPPIPPETGWISSSKQANMWALRNRYLAERDTTAPHYYSVDNDPDNWTIISDKTKDDLILIQKKSVCNLSRCLFFVNGLCCYPTVESNPDYGMQVRLHDGGKLLKNAKDRDRGIVVVDFRDQCQVEFYPTSMFVGELPDLIVNDTINPTENSYLLSLDGRLYLPEEFTVFSDRQLHIKVPVGNVEYQLDRLCCMNKFSSMIGSHAASRTIVLDKDEQKLNLKEAGNSFLIVLNKTGLQVVRHQSQSNPSSSSLSEKMNAAEYHRAQFNGSAKGLLFDGATRSVHSYLREEDNMSFADDEGTTLRKWRIAQLYTTPTTLLEIWGKYNNDMSASASMHDRSDVRGSAFLLRPKYTMLDFIFEG